MAKTIEEFINVVENDGIPNNIQYALALLLVRTSFDAIKILNKAISLVIERLSKKYSISEEHSFNLSNTSQNV